MAWRAVVATAVRSLRAYFRYPFNAVMQLFNFVAWLPPLYFLGRAFMVDGSLPGLAAYAGTDDYAAFLVVGWIAAGFVYAAYWGVGFSLYEEMTTGTLEAVWLAPAPRWAVLVGRSVHMLVVTAVQAGVVLAASWLLGVRFAPDAVRAVWVLLPGLVALYGLGLAVAALVLVAKNPNNLIDMVSYGMNFLSGDRVPVASFPAPLLWLALAMPTTYAFDGIRHALLGTTPLLPFWTELVLLCALALLTAGLGWVAFRAADRRVRVGGTLGHH
ncbi:MAG: ABC transporter permease [Armatimonadota bacterium]|nr:ABC transporter permease [Armatimonadota bacterium]MDR5697600.1 ABC transporter permease [Armatimonadota bacterium]